MEKLHGFWN